MNRRSKLALAALFDAAATILLVGGEPVLAQTLQTHRIPAALALEAVGEAVAACARQGYSETAVLVDSDGVHQAVLRGDGAGHIRSIAQQTRPIPAPRSRLTPALWSSGRRRHRSPRCLRNFRICSCSEAAS
jgi:hypothetical protein